MSSNKKLWILIRNPEFASFVSENPAVKKQAEELALEMIPISLLTDLKMEPEDKVIVFMPETEEILRETPTPELWREFMFGDCMFNPNIYASQESELWKRIADGGVFNRMCRVMQQLCK